MMLVSGVRGSGKTSVLANWLSELPSLNENKTSLKTRNMTPAIRSTQTSLRISVVSHHVGASSLSFDVIGLMRRLTVALKGQSSSLSGVSPYSGT